MFFPSKTATLLVASADAEDQRTYADFVCDGIDDHIELQAALDQLRITGGKIYLTEGEYNLGAPLTRQIDNVMIEGAGRATRLNYNGGDAVISAGQQAGWNLIDFDTDGGVDISSATESVANYWQNKIRRTTIAENKINSNPLGNGLKISNIYVDEDRKLKVEYDDGL